MNNETYHNAGTRLTVIVGIRPQFGYLGSPSDTQVLCLFVNNALLFEGYIYADAGTFALTSGLECSG